MNEENATSTGPVGHNKVMRNMRLTEDNIHISKIWMNQITPPPY